MKFHDRQIVEGTEPTVYLGHRVRTASNGTLKFTPMWYAEYCLHNRQRFEFLGTSNKNTTIQKAHEICARIRTGQPVAPKPNTTLKQITDGYVELMKAHPRYILQKGWRTRKGDVLALAPTYFNHNIEFRVVCATPTT
jgi:hypothetical protein